MGMGKGGRGAISSYNIEYRPITELKLTTINALIYYIFITTYPGHLLDILKYFGRCAPLLTAAQEDETQQAVSLGAVGGGGTGLDVILAEDGLHGHQGLLCPHGGGGGGRRLLQSLPANPVKNPLSAVHAELYKERI
jgi:hypothetical protein